MEVRMILGGDFSMAKKGQQFQRYSNEFKQKAVLAYVNGFKSYKVVAEELGIRHGYYLFHQ
jgi:transposase